MIKRTRNVEVIGIDRAVWSKNINIPFIRCDVETGLPFRDSTFHCIFAGEVIEHVYDTDFLIEECYRVLKPGGSLILTTPNLVAFAWRMSMLFGKRPAIIHNRKPLPERPGEHIRYFTSRDLRDILVDHGFEIVKFCVDGVKFFPDGTSEIMHPIGMLNCFQDFLGRILLNFGLRLIVKARKP